jgi:hypothetical protein
MEFERPEPWPSVGKQASGGFVSTDRVALWHANHPGPSYSKKAENQDATFALADGPRVYFALADGVSSSYGSRFAAAAIASLFCSNLQRVLKPVAKPDSTLLKEAAGETHDWLDCTLSYLLANPTAREWSDVRGATDVRADTAMQLFENTQNPTNREWGPVLAATLVGGVIQPAEKGKGLELYAIRIGDGLIEQIASLGDEGGVSHVLSMDSRAGESPAALSPGPAGLRWLETPDTLRCFIGPRESLVISSDGLARGHSDMVSEQLREIVGKPDLGLRDGDKKSALKMLQAAADYADAAVKANPKFRLFDDDLSVIVVEGGR